MMFNNNYVYDAIGNLIKDQQEEIDSMIWRPDGKLEAVVRSSASSKLNLKFDYDVSGKRVAKHIFDANENLLHSTYYVRDAQGNVMSVYKLNIDTVLSSLSYAQKERHIYGSSMLGMDTDSLEMIGATVADSTLFSYMVGNKRYSMSNHLGNVLAVVTDKKLPVPVSGLVSYYLPEVFSTSDYSPFGVELDGRNFNSEKFRYGLGNHEKDREIQKGWYEFGGFGYDPRRVQRPTLDQVVKDHESGYAAFGNSPVWLIDPDGKDTLVVHRDTRFEVMKGSSPEFDALIFKVTASIISNGVETTIPGSFLMYTSKSGFERGSNSFTNLKESNNLILKEEGMRSLPKLKPTFQLYNEDMSKIGERGTFLHQGSYPWNFEGCATLTCDPPIMETSLDRTFPAAENTQDALKSLKSLRDNLDPILTGNKFIMKTNSAAPKMEKTPIINVTEIPHDND